MDKLIETWHFFLFFWFPEEENQVCEAILNCSLTGGSREAFEDEFQSEEDEEEWLCAAKGSSDVDFLCNVALIFYFFFYFLRDWEKRRYEAFKQAPYCVEMLLNNCLM